MRNWMGFVCLLLCGVLLSGCVGNAPANETEGTVSTTAAENVLTFQDMVYIRPDMDVVEDTLARACEAAAGEDFDKIMDLVYEFYDVYDTFYTNYSLADIHYCRDLTDTYWEEEYFFCSDQTARVDAALEELYYALADSPCRRDLESRNYFGQGFFDSYDGENMWDEDFIALLDEEARLQSEYYTLSGETEYESGTWEYYDAYAPEMGQLLVDLIRLRQEIARYWGYDSYPQFAADFYHSRDYSLEDSQAYLDSIQKELVDLYRKMNATGIWDWIFTHCGEKETYAYVKEMAENMGGAVEEAFRVMDQGELYDIGYGKNKYAASFEVYLTSYGVPFIFMDPGMNSYDKLTFAHEFGHFCNDYASYGSYAGVDVLEFFSQGMEYLSLCYTEADEDLYRLKMADSLALYVEQAAYASFEMRMYELSGEELTVENLTALYDQVVKEYGMDSLFYDPREYVEITHYYTNPMYILSYVVSNDAALQLYQVEMENQGAGLACFEENLSTEESYLLSFLESAGLESPFAEGRLQSVRKIFEELFG